MSEAHREPVVEKPRSTSRLRERVSRSGRTLASAKGDSSTPGVSLVGDQQHVEELLRFYALAPAGRTPIRADASALGTLPTRAYRYCEAIRVASGFGWYIFPALNFSLLWDSGGDGVYWRCRDIALLKHWQPLGDAVQFPDFTTLFDRTAPEDVRGFAPPWLAQMREPAHIQIWSGLVARTRAEVGLLVRPAANLSRQAGYEVYEGILEADQWFGPLFTNVRLTRSDRPVEFRTDWPIAQVQPIPRTVYADPALDRVLPVVGVDEFTGEDWAAFRRAVVAPSLRPERPYGENAAERRRRARAATGS